MLTGPDPFFPNPNVNGKKRSGYARLASGADTHHAETKQQLDHAMQEIATDVKKVKEIVFGWSEQLAKVANCTACIAILTLNFVIVAIGMIKLYATGH